MKKLFFYIGFLCKLMRINDLAKLFDSCKNYIYMGGIILVLALLVKLSPLPEIDLDEDGNVAHMSIFKQIINALKFPQLVLGVITLMLYLAAEVLAGDSIGGFGKQLGVLLCMLLLK